MQRTLSNAYSVVGQYKSQIKNIGLKLARFLISFLVKKAVEWMTSNAIFKIVIFYCSIQYNWSWHSHIFDWIRLHCILRRLYSQISLNPNDFVFFLIFRTSFREFVFFITFVYSKQQGTVQQDSLDRVILSREDNKKKNTYNLLEK